MPTASQIEAPVALPTNVVRLYVGGAWAAVTADVLSAESEYSASGNADNGIGFGLAPEPTARVAFAREQVTTAWDQTPIEILFGFNGTNPRHFLGLIMETERTSTGGTWSASGYRSLIAAAPEIRSPLLYRRPVFTATSAVSNENPDSGGWGGGLGNLILWRAGGRPYAQAASYPSALFYYECETAILAPEWSWLNGGDAAQVLDELCRAAGGIAYQGLDGVVRYQEPMTFGGGATAIHYTDSADVKDAATRVSSGLAQYGDIRWRGVTRREVVDIARCAYTARRLQGVQQIYQDKTPRLIEPGGSLTLALDLQLPCYRVDRVLAAGYTLRSARTVSASELTVTVGATYAQQVNVTLTNTLGEGVGVSEVTAYGMPLVAMEEGTASHGSAGSTPRSYAVPDSVYIQTASHARRLCHMYWDFYHVARPTVELTGCGYDPRRTLGEVVLLTSAPLGIAAEAHRISGLRVSQSGTTMDLTLVNVSDLPVAADFFQLGASYADGDVRQLIY
jgi:hypothetical protein